MDREVPSSPVRKRLLLRKDGWGKTWTTQGNMMQARRVTLRFGVEAVVGTSATLEEHDRCLDGGRGVKLSEK